MNAHKNISKMKKNIIILGVSIALLSCGNGIIKEKDIGIKDMKIVIIDSCEYIQYHTYVFESITHKGNCKFCAKRNNKNQPCHHQIKK